MEPRPAHTDQPLRAMHLAVDVGFGVLMVVSGFRHFSYHPVHSLGIVVLLLAGGSTLAYGVAVLGPRQRMRQIIGISTSAVLWLPLAVIAPSFSWCAFAFVFAVHRVLQRRLAVVASAVIVFAVSLGLLVMSEGQDLGLVLGPFFGGLVISAVYAALDRTLENRRILTEELIATREQLATTEREAGAFAERERFASELHDTVVQRTATALLLLESNHETLASGALAAAEARDVLREALIETRRLLHGLQPPAEQESLAGGLHTLASSHGADFTLIGEEQPLNEEIIHAVLRVVQEALANAVKHANASSMRVTLTFFENALGVNVEDDGDGFDPAAAAEQLEGYGLRAMAWRFENLGGTFTLESSPGLGTVIAGIIPTITDEGLHQ